ncbi:MAG: adenine phosphoribosyltransferase [Eubacteriales bacterium]|nr:adenine phosphoribosyltransferase [Eubacteriales bacterium]
MDLSTKLRHVHHFPRRGIDFIDITTVLKDADLFREAIDQMVKLASKYEFDVIVGAEARGFIVGAPVAYAMHKPFVPIRKPNKLPAETVSVRYSLEYGEDQLEIHKDAILPGQRVLVIDDLLATGGTARANCRLVEKLGAIVAANLFFIELDELNGRSDLEGYVVDSVCKVHEDKL